MGVAETFSRLVDLIELNTSSITSHSKTIATLIKKVSVLETEIAQLKEQG